MVRALGGRENIKSLDNCITRLRLTVANMELIDEVAIKRAGGIAVVKLDQNTLQVIIGTKIIALRRDMSNYMGVYWWIFLTLLSPAKEHIVPNGTFARTDLV